MTCTPAVLMSAKLGLMRCKGVQTRKRVRTACSQTVKALCGLVHHASFRPSSTNANWAEQPRSMHTGVQQPHQALRDRRPPGRIAAISATLAEKEAAAGNELSSNSQRHERCTCKARIVRASAHHTEREDRGARHRVVCVVAQPRQRVHRGDVRR